MRAEKWVFALGLALGMACLLSLCAIGWSAAPIYDDLDLLSGAGVEPWSAYALKALPFDPNYWRPLPMAGLWWSARLTPGLPFALSSALCVAFALVLAWQFWNAACVWGSAAKTGWFISGCAGPALACHPAMAACWAWRSGVFDLSLALALALSWWICRVASERSGARWGLGYAGALFASFASVALCVACKEMIWLPLGLIALWASRGPARQWWVWGLGASLGLGLLAWGRWTSLSYMFASMDSGMSALVFAPQAAGGYLASLAGLGAPVWASAYDVPSGWTWLSAGAGTWALWACARSGSAGRWAAGVAGAHVIILCAALGSGLVNGDSYYASRYMAFCPALLALACAPALWRSGVKTRRWIALGSLVLLGCWFAGGAREALFWRSPFFWSKALEASPHSPVALGWRVGELRGANPAAALELCSREAQGTGAKFPSAPARGLGYFCSALALEKGQPRDALDYALAYQAQWGSAPELAYLAGVAALRMGQKQRAEEYLGSALRVLKAMPETKKGASRKALQARLMAMSQPA